MKARTVVARFLMIPTLILLTPVIGEAADPGHVTILYTSDELGYVNPCG